MQSAPDSAAPDTIRTVVDSIFPVEEEIRRFAAQLPNSRVSALSPAVESRELLVQQFITAIEAKDTATLNTLVLSPREFIDLYYPASPYTRPPYRQSPSFVWFLIQQNSRKGMSRALDRFGGRPLSYGGADCKGGEPQGDNKFWECAVRVNNAAGLSTTIRLFGSIMERDGRHKFVSFANDL